MAVVESLSAAASLLERQARQVEASAELGPAGVLAAPA